MQFNLVLVISISVLIGYTLFFLYLSAFLQEHRFNKQAFQDQSNTDECLISVIIPFRNEIENLPELFSALANLNYNKFEVIFVNDHSSDRSEIMVHKRCLQNPKYKLLSLDGETGKKAAQRLAFEHANGEIIAFTDADCIPAKGWLHQINAAFKSKRTILYMGMLVLEKGKKLVQRFFETEFYSLIFSGAAMAKIDLPVYCNAANMAVRKEVLDRFLQKSTIHSESGDDVFLLHAVKKWFGSQSIVVGGFKKDVVSAQLPVNFKEFLLQRMRWGSKSIFYRDNLTFGLALLISLSSGLVLLTLIQFAFYKEFIFLTPFFLKTIGDLFFFRQGFKLVNRNRLLFLVPFFELLYVFYLPVTAILSVVVPVRWKGRNVKKRSDK